MGQRLGRFITKYRTVYFKPDKRDGNIIYSPFDITFVITGCSGYIGNKASYEYRSYETDTGMFAVGTGEKMAEKYVELLNSIQ